MVCSVVTGAAFLAALVAQETHRPTACLVKHLT